MPKATRHRADIVDRKLSVLCIDDDELACNSLAALIWSFGHEVVTAGNGDDGLQKFSQSAYDCVITDMSPTSGLDVTQMIKQTASSTFVVLVSGFPKDQVMAKFQLSLAPDAILEKPVPAEQLAAVLVTVSDR